MNILFFDTETTGLVHEKLSPTHPRQPMPVQIGAKLDDGKRIERIAANVLIQPDSWNTTGQPVVSERAAEVTGINDEIANSYGLSLITAMEMFLDLVYVADLIVAHNAPFDLTVMRRAAAVYYDLTKQEYVDPFDSKKVICTMRVATPLLKLTPKRYGQYKWPRLEECMKFYWNETLEGAHDALVDVRATARLFYKLYDDGHMTGGVKPGDAPDAAEADPEVEAIAETPEVESGE